MSNSGSGAGQKAMRLFSQIKEEHRKLIHEQTEKAKDRSTYETYDYGVSKADKKIKLFTARRKGISHEQNNIPCQDYCLTYSSKENGCTVLADADGVGSCEHSDIGSKFACEAVVQTVDIASKSCDSEDLLVDRLLSVSFRKRLVNYWIKSVMTQINKKPSLSYADQLKEFDKYASTIMYAVITENWIVVGNLGDGQILVFNDSYGVKLRVHAPKYSSEVRCLVNERCVREDFQTAKYPRKFFNGVLLSSDGIYDSLDNGNHFYEYGIQMKKRFLENNEPFQAFCYEEKNELFKDFSKMRTQDDCSIALAIDETKIDTQYESILNSIKRHTDNFLLRRWAPECMAFSCKKGDKYFDVTAANFSFTLPEGFESTSFETPVETWDENGRSYSMYNDTGFHTIEFMQCSGMLQRDRTNPDKSGQLILDVYTQIKKLQDKLAKYGLELNSSALFNISYGGGSLHVRHEALKKAEAGQSDAGHDGIEKCFSHLLGVLKSENGELPLFDIGYINIGTARYHTTINSTNEEFVQLIQENKKIKLKNISRYLWKFDDGITLMPGEALKLAKEMSFTVFDSPAEKELGKYRYISKEEFL